MILQLPGMRLIHLAQGLYGAPSSKQTTLLVLRMSGLERHLHDARLCSHIITGASVGKTDTGHFKTSPLKEYSLGFCTALAKGFAAEFCTSSACVDQGTLPQPFLDLCHQMRDHEFGTVKTHVP